jgi:hypothetical protein
MYIVFTGQCEVYKTRNEFKNFDELGNELLIDSVEMILENPTSTMNLTQQQNSSVMENRKELLIQENNTSNAVKGSAMKMR